MSACMLAIVRVTCSRWSVMLWINAASRMWETGSAADTFGLELIVYCIKSTQKNGHASLGYV